MDRGSEVSIWVPTLDADGKPQRIQIYKGFRNSKEAKKAFFEGIFLNELLQHPWIVEMWSEVSVVLFEIADYRKGMFVDTALNKVFHLTKPVSGKMDFYEIVDGTASPPKVRPWNYPEADLVKRQSITRLAWAFAGRVRTLLEALYRVHQAAGSLSGQATHWTKHRIITATKYYLRTGIVTASTTGSPVVTPISAGAVRVAKADVPPLEVTVKPPPTAEERPPLTLTYKPHDI